MARAYHETYGQDVVVTRCSNNYGPYQFPEKLIPLMLLETDSPYLAAEPLRGKRNHPALVGFTAVAVAALKNIPVDEVWTVTGQNARDFFKLEEP